MSVLAASESIPRLRWTVSSPSILCFGATIARAANNGRDLSAYALDDYSRTKHVMHSKAR
ncbi:hypothetical protein [Arthrobacter sp. NyZ413]|uniref:hypothetical protein n=1 Tax=Arthrobacter sp. NyZ413 TaxID=3144669 RepID=UPI003BF8F3CE